MYYQVKKEKFNLQFSLGFFFGFLEGFLHEITIDNRSHRFFHRGSRLESEYDLFKNHVSASVNFRFYLGNI